ncbi:very-long-chain 3-oxoacyl-CoA reductase [Sitophilus oryzae]|uniref:Very-long-chain 3-oxoacyl-CoA reductase n=1 Tax=Sitophilus oryzae TaxID=7048 RepID=A0A6J2Y020_SITOR|nr:very-long-chain 3-oxoacyl-CoA reductase [Sitophilus oryzae]
MASQSTSAMEKIGIICTFIVGFYLIRFLLKFLYLNFFAPTLKINAVKLNNSVGKWAVVTGATDGIGKAYAEALAKRKLNIVLISRTQCKLDAVAQDIQTKYTIETKTIQADFTKNINEIYHVIDKQLHGLDIGVLINNIGMSYPYPEYFLELKNKDEIYDNIIKCNILSVTNMCKIVLPGMVERGRGVIINISSMASLIPSPLLSVYSASKSFINKFTEDLETEYSRCGVTIQCLFPGYVASNMSKIKTSTWMAPAPSKYVEQAIRSLGIRSRTTGYFPHTLLLGVITFLDAISPMLSRWINTKIMLNIRARALRRQTL